VQSAVRTWFIFGCGISGLVARPRFMPFGDLKTADTYSAGCGDAAQAARSGLDFACKCTFSGGPDRYWKPVCNVRAGIRGGCVAGGLEPVDGENSDHRTLAQLLNKMNTLGWRGPAGGDGRPLMRTWMK
jgi:hypothetical protein